MVLKILNLQILLHHKDLFLLAEKEVKKLEKLNFKKFENLLKLHDKAEIINEIGN